MKKDIVTPQTKQGPHVEPDPIERLDSAAAEMMGYVNRPPLFARYAQKDKTQDLIDLYAHELAGKYQVGEQDMHKMLTNFAEALSESGSDSF